MSNLLIIGNGFDLAHGLKTSYSNFMEYLIDSKIADNNLFRDLFEFEVDFRVRYSSYNEIIEQRNDRYEIFQTKNIFFSRLAKQFIQWNWCDIEKQYFNELSTISKQSRYKNAKTLNQDFEILKNHLAAYLKLEQEKFKKLNAYRELFRLTDSESTLILNFNYTNTIQKYLEDNKASKLVQIHGMLEKDSNPIIFGYAADNNEARQLVNLDDKEYMRNIKKHNYKRTNEEDRLLDYLSDNEEIEVAILGHSCGISDKLILNQIVNSRNVIKIRLFYHLNYEHYFETQVNLDRIMNNDQNFEKLVNFQRSLPMPQYIESETDNDFLLAFKSIIGSQRSKNIGVTFL